MRRSTKPGGAAAAPSPPSDDRGVSPHGLDGSPAAGGGGAAAPFPAALPRARSSAALVRSTADSTALALLAARALASSGWSSASGAVVRSSSETPPMDTDDVRVAMLPYGMFTYTALSTPRASVNGTSIPSRSSTFGFSSRSSRSCREPATYSHKRGGAGARWLRAARRRRRGETRARRFGPPPDGRPAGRSSP